MKKILVIAIILCLSGISVVLALTYKMWGVGIFSGALKVDAYLKTPTEEGVTNDPAMIGIWSGNKKIGDSGTEIQVTSGQYTLSFGNYSSEYQKPQEQTVFVKPFETTYVSVYYLAKFGYVKVKIEAYDAYYQNYSSASAEIFVNGESRGFSNTSQPLSVRLNATLSYNVSFAFIDEYVTPEDQNVTIGNAEIKEIAGKYERILTSEQSIYVHFRDHRWLKDSSYYWTLDPESNIVLDHFYEDVLDGRKTQPSFFTEITKGTSGSHGGGEVAYFIAQYVGIYETDRINALVGLYNTLIPFGINLTDPTQQQTSTAVGGYSVYFGLMHYANQSQYIIFVQVHFWGDFRNLMIVNDEGEIYKFNETRIDNIPDISSQLTPDGVGISFNPCEGVFVKQGTTTVSFEDIYVPPFTEYSNVPQGAKGWWCRNWWPSDFRQFLKSLRMIF